MSEYGSANVNAQRPQLKAVESNYLSGRLANCHSMLDELNKALTETFTRLDYVSIPSPPKSESKQEPQEMCSPAEHILSQIIFRIEELTTGVIAMNRNLRV